MSLPTVHQRPALLNLGRQSIRAQLAWLVLAAVLPAFAVSQWYLLGAREDARNVAREKVKILVDTTVARLVGSLSVHEALLSQIAEQPQIRSLDPANCGLTIRDFVRLHPEYVTISTRDRGGEPVCALAANPPSAQTVSSYGWFEQGWKADKFHASDAFFAPQAQRWVTILTMPIRDSAGTQTGLVVLPLDLSTLNPLMLGGVPRSSVVTVTDRNGVMLMRSVDPAKWIGQPASPNALEAQERASGDGFTSRVGADGIRRVVAFRYLPVGGWRVGAGVPEADVFADADRALRNGVLGSIALLLGALVLAWRLGFGIIRPLDELAATAARVAAGDTLARAPTGNGPPELESVADEFNRMLDARTAAQAVLRESEENLSITLQSIGDAVIATDAQGRVTRMNPTAERLTGWVLAQALGRPLVEVFRIVNAQTREISQDPVQRVLETGQVVGLANHTTLLARDGDEYQISDSAAPIRDNTGEIVGVVLVFSDVSDQYLLQQVLMESEDRYRALVESSPVGVAMHRQGVIFYVNATAVRTLGAKSSANIVGRALIDFVHPDYYPLLAERGKQARDVAPGTALPMAEWKYLRLDGTVIDVQAQATVVTLKGDSAVHVSFLDITDRKRAERTLRDNEERFRALTYLSSDWYWEQDDQFRFVRVDGDLLTSTGLTAQSQLGKTRWEMDELSLSEADWDRHRQTLRAHQEFRDFQIRRPDNNGKELWVSVSGTPIFDAQGVFRGYRGIGRDVTAQKLAADQIHALAFYDALTELPNRRLLIEQLKKALAAHARSRRQAALLFIDLDNFKTLNDTLGHETGDMLLRQVARRLLNCVREVDSVARLGGDEFVVMLEDLSVDIADAAVQAEHVGLKILAAFEAPYELGGRQHRSTPSIGITLFGGGDQGVEDLLKQADLAMYQAKAAGRNTLRLFDAGMQARVDARVALETDLRAALETGQMLLHYQSVVQADGAVTGAEALVRWQHPVRGRVAPGEFIAVAEATRLILPLGQWVLETACAQLASWATGERTARLTLAVNVSAHQFVEPDFVERVLQAVDASGADPRRLKLELTESLLADNMEDVVRKMGALKERGIDFSLDDFGTGYSSLSYLKRLPLAQLKIDQSFVQDVLVDPNDAAIARTIVALGGSLGLAVIAEGVETEGQRQFLLDIGCHNFQGYLFGRPVPIEEFDASLPEHDGHA